MFRRARLRRLWRRKLGKKTAEPGKNAECKSGQQPCPLQLDEGFNEPTLSNELREKGFFVPSSTQTSPASEKAAEAATHGLVSATTSPRKLDSEPPTGKGLANSTDLKPGLTREVGHRFLTAKRRAISQPAARQCTPRASTEAPSLVRSCSPPTVKAANTISNTGSGVAAPEAEWCTRLKRKPAVAKFELAEPLHRQETQGPSAKQGEDSERSRSPLCPPPQIRWCPDEPPTWLERTKVDLVSALKDFVSRTRPFSPRKVATTRWRQQAQARRVNGTDVGLKERNAADMAHLEAVDAQLAGMRSSGDRTEGSGMSGRPSLEAEANGTRTKTSCARCHRYKRHAEQAIEEIKAIKETTKRTSEISRASEEFIRVAAEHRPVLPMLLNKLLYQRQQAQEQVIVDLAKQLADAQRRNGELVQRNFVLYEQNLKLLEWNCDTVRPMYRQLRLHGSQITSTSDGLLKEAGIAIQNNFTFLHEPQPTVANADQDEKGPPTGR